MNNNENVQKIVAKLLPLYYHITKAPNISDLFIFCLSIINIHSCKSKCTTKNKDSPIATINTTTKKQNDSNLFILVVSIKSVDSCDYKHANTKNNDNK